MAERKDNYARIAGFHKQSIAKRIELLAQATGIDAEQLQKVLGDGGIDAQGADKIVENVVGTYALPFGVALNFRVNGEDYIVPMAVEEPSVIAAASNAAKMVRQSGGFTATSDSSVMASQIQIYDVASVPIAKERIMAAKQALLEQASHVLGELVSLGGGPKDLDVRVLSSNMIVVHVYIDCLDAMGANMCNSVAEELGPAVARLAEGKLGLRILSNLCDRRTVRASCRVNQKHVVAKTVSGEETIDGIVNASQFAELDPYRAVTHNKGIMNGIDPVVIATGNDWRAVEAGAHAYAARSGHYGPLAVWRKVKAEGEVWLEGTLQMPLALGTVGGTLRAHPLARLTLDIMGIRSSQQLAMVAACAGLASNLAALRALATEGIQRGHIALHARSVAMSVGAKDDEVEKVAKKLSEAKDTTIAHAKKVLEKLRA